MAGVTDSPFDRILDLVADCFTPEVAKRLAAVRFDDALNAQLNELADKANEGQLSEEERSSYIACINLMDFVAMLRLKAIKMNPEVDR